ncbi:MAG: FAD:protein transferase [Chloroflexia bacterium]|nr:FAD:protein transferase [Chloroflexia bacterium]
MQTTNEPHTIEPAGVQSIEFRAMGSQVLAAIASHEPEAGMLLGQVPGWFEVWEAVLSRFREDSELSRLNQQAGSASPVPVSQVLWEVIQLALEAAHTTGGLVTPTVLNALEQAGYNSSFDIVSRPNNLSPATVDPLSRERVGEKTGTESVATATPDWHRIETYRDTQSVRLPAGVRLDLGGIAKGWAAGEAASRLAKLGPALVDAGGDIAVRGTAASSPVWPVGVDAPSLPPFEPDEQIELLTITSGGVATSGQDYRRWQQDGEWRHHIIDPRTGRPAITDVLSATVVAPTAAAAEIAAKVVLVLGSEKGLEWLEEHASLAGLLVLESGEILRSQRLHNYIWSSHNGS